MNEDRRFERRRSPGLNDRVREGCSADCCFGRFIRQSLGGMLIMLGYLVTGAPLLAQRSIPTSDLVLARVQYRGGGDWYNDPSALPNLCRFIRAHSGVDVAEEEASVNLTDETLFSYPFLFLTGHGNITLSDEEAERLRTYLLKGGFLYIDDDYGLDPYIRKVMKKVFPGRSFYELPFSHGIYSVHFSFPNGLPKIHEHDNLPPRGYGMNDDDGRLMVFYTVETNLSDGWADPDVHGDPPETREAALRMGANIVIWALLK